MDLPDDVWMSIFDLMNEESCGYYTPASVIRWELAFIKCTSKHLYHLCRAYLARYAKLEDDLFGEDPDLQPEDLLCSYLAYRGYFNCLKYAHEHGSSWDRKTAWNAAQGGNLLCLQYVRENGCGWSSKVCKMAAAGGYLDCLKYAIDNGCGRDVDTTTAAIKGGHYDCFKYAKDTGCRVVEFITDIAVRYQHFEIFKQLVKDGYKVNLDVAKEAARSGNIECMALAIDNLPSHLQRSWEIMTAAARSRSLESVIYLHQMGFDLNAHMCIYAIELGHLSIVRYYCDNRVHIEDPGNLAAKSGHLPILKYFHEIGAEWNEDTCAAAAKFGHLEILKYLHENGCPWNASTTYYAAFHGSLACIKYAHENGCPWDPLACDASQNDEVTEYLHANGCPCNHNRF